ncbi:Elastase inhibitor AFLEI Flags: Precursor [Pseudoxanthomonas broegbernensis]|uniref:Elastase inhibitor AFLEI Flags n=1 Tax=Pseudoxanthomonas broegbernensis TaxID=83619 RepID=A0A7V8GNA7_9GAMM|nr:I78 family peptidase inhibitor [Pseudoxanthomonas broegbernensis]KAF1686892.1 Elastase inhibitor AFLEI Flags: Precursor [Pseudoxanthomonas broegbernensis]MBB6065515.1 hypothetical protein [Pseudoxanthomonas broegbernensis]
MSARTIHSLLFLALVSLTAACAPATAPEDDAAEQEQAIVAAQRAAEQAAEAPAADTPPAPVCDASQALGLVGQAFEEAAAEQARIDTGAARVRVLRPGQAVTLEFDGARLNIELGEDGRIVALRCG